MNYLKYFPITCMKYLCFDGDFIISALLIILRHHTYKCVLVNGTPLSCFVFSVCTECNHCAQERKDIFGRRDVLESFRFHPTLIVLFLKQIELYYKF